jgi:hypothetical protein
MAGRSGRGRPPMAERLAVLAAGPGLAISLAASLTASLAAAATAQATEADSWTARTCDLYRRAVGDALALPGPDGLGQAFMEAHAAFLEGGCVDRAPICARREQEIAVADLLTVMTMTEGMASTFVPFGCPDRRNGAGPAGRPRGIED